MVWVKDRPPRVATSTRPPVATHVEVSHKLLHRGAVSLPGDDPDDTLLQNERLTDLGAVWPGPPAATAER